MPRILHAYKQSNVLFARKLGNYMYRKTMLGIGKHIFFETGKHIFVCIFFSDKKRFIT
jgi:hypothetical protein